MINTVEYEKSSRESHIYRTSAKIFPVFVGITLVRDNILLGVGFFGRFIGVIDLVFITERNNIGLCDKKFKDIVEKESANKFTPITN